MKKYILISVVTVFFFFCLKTVIGAQVYQKEAIDPADFFEEFSKLQIKLDALSNNSERIHREILRKLDQVLSNQEKIFSELAIIKVRASKR